MKPKSYGAVAEAAYAEAKSKGYNAARSWQQAATAAIRAARQRSRAAARKRRGGRLTPSQSNYQSYLSADSGETFFEWLRRKKLPLLYP